MGGTSSKTTVDILNSVAVSASMRTVQSCTTAASQNQLIQLQAVGDVTLGDINQSQGVSVNTECLFSTAKKNEMAASMSNDIVAKLSASSEGFLKSFGGSHSDAVTNIKNMFTAAVNMVDIQNNVTSSMQRQTLSVNAGGNLVAGNISQSQTAEIIAKSIVESKNTNKVIQDIANAVDQNASSSNVGTAAALAKYIVIIVVVVIIGGIIAAAVRAYQASQEEYDLSGLDEEPSELQSVEPTELQSAEPSAPELQLDEKA